MQRLAALVPRPRLHLIRFHGVLAPNAKLRALVVQQEVPQVPETPAQAVAPAECEANCVHHRAVRLSWAQLLKRVFDLDLQHCPNCGGDLRNIAAILGPPVIEKILSTWVCRPGRRLGHQPVARRCKRPEAAHP